MKNPLIINIRCSCIEEYINIQRLHKEYTRQLRTGEIMSVFVGAELAVPGEYAVVDKLMEKGGQCRKPPVAAFPMAFNNTLSQEEQMAIKEEINRGAVVVNGPMPEEEIALPQAVDGGVDAMGNPPLPEKPLTVDEARSVKPDYADRPFDPNVEDYRAESKDWKVREEPLPVESEVHKSFAFEEEPVPESMFKKVPETLTEPDFTQVAPSVLEESDDGWNGEDHNYTC